jgi:ketosteroid isomerase-like protein
VPDHQLAVTRIVHDCFNSYVDKDRSNVEALIADDFHFTSPLDNRIDRESYFERCWPNSANMQAVDLKHVVVIDEQVFVTYECTLNDGKRLRNTELWTLKNGKITEVEVYFGWRLPHEAAPGKSLPTL